jgi:catechol 2,3-dioxygenase-like lactoylglutathione lyase family enzyme
VATIDHLILPVNDVAASVAFYAEVLGFRSEGERPPFAVVRVDDDFVLQLAPWGTEGNVHLAFALSRRDFDAAFERIKARAVPFGASFHAVGSGTGPGVEDGARGPAPTLYCSDPNGHLIEIRTYEDA